MRIIIVSNYYHPESVGAAIWVTQLAEDLRDRDHDVTIVTSLPSYPEGTIYKGYQNRFWQREVVNRIEVIRTFTYASPSKSFWSRVASFGTFCLSAAPGYLPWRRPVDVVYAVLPPLPLGVAAWAIAAMSGAKLITNIQDIYPDIAAALGYVANPLALKFFANMERWIYRRSDRVVVISKGFRENLLAKGVPPEKICVVPNWADADDITPASRENPFRSETGATSEELLVLYSGGLTHNAELDTVLNAASLVRHLPVRFAIVGEGVQKQSLQERARALGLDNVKFFPFQPLTRYPEVLAAADLTLVTLNSAATFASVPSKVYKQMSAGRPIIAITESNNELTRLIDDAKCGVAVAPGDTQALAHVFDQASQRKHVFAEMGRWGRSYVERNCSRRVCVAQIETAMLGTHKHVRTRSESELIT